MGDLLLRAGLANALSAAILAAVVAVAALPLRRRRPAAVHALWLLVLLKLITPPLWDVPVRWPAPPAAAARVQEPPSFSAAPAEYFDARPSPPAPVEGPARPAPVQWAEVAAALSCTVWVGGSIACLLLIAKRSLQFHRLLRHAEPAPPGVVRRAEAIAARFALGKCPAVWFLPGAVCPMLYAASGRARLLLPRGLWDRLDDDRRDTLVAHEMAHLRRRDHWVRLVEVAATVLYWWHPVLWYARRGLREAEEQCCDAWVVWSMPAAARHYMSAILEAVEYVSEPDHRGGTPRDFSPFARATVPALASGMGEFRRLERRLWMIRRNESPRRLSRPTALAVLPAAAAALPLAPTMADPEPTASDDSRREVVVRATDPAAGAENPGSAGADQSLSYRVRLKSVRVSDATDGNTTDSFADSTGINTFETSDSGPLSSIEITNIVDHELQQARAAVDAARANLAAATARLAQLEAQAAQGRAKAENAPPRADNLLTSPKENHPAADPDRRMEKLERKLEQIDARLNELREEKARGGKEPTSVDQDPSAGRRR